MLRKRLLACFSTLNRKQMKQFDQISEWWHPSGPMHILYQYNYQRVQFLKQHLITELKVDPIKPFHQLRVLDVGCGAGFLTKSLARLGAEVVGVDPNSTSYREAVEHKAKLQQDLPNLNYFNCTLQEYLSNPSSSIQEFDIVTSMDVIEHVDNPTRFLSDISRATKQGGLVMVSTIAKNPITWLTHIVLAEYVTKIVPKHTHSYDKFINPQELQEMLTSLGIQVISRRELQINWRGEFAQKQGGGNYILLGKKSQFKVEGKEGRAE